jgi:glycosyltransferase involved in cell wall biosynthesis
LNPLPSTSNVAAGYLPQVVVAHTGARMHYGVPVVLNRLGLLGHFYTDAYAGNGSWLHYIVSKMPNSLNKGAVRRLSQRVANLPADKVTAFNMMGLINLYEFYRKRHNGTFDTLFYIQYARSFLSKVSRLVNQGTAVYCFSGMGLELFQAAKDKGLFSICEQISAPIQQYAPLLQNEASRWPNWQVDGDICWDKAWYLREVSEWQAADAIIAPSEYVQNTLIKAGVPPRKIVLIPYAVSTERYHGRIRSYNGQRPLRILFVGHVNLNKGVPYLLEALKKLGPHKVHAKFVGYLSVASEKLSPYEDVADFEGYVSRSEVVRFYDWADLFVLPSLSEGSAVVTYEARACGLPLIVTPNTGAWLQEEVDGFTVPVRDSDGLAEALTRFLDKPDLVAKMSKGALGSALTFSWDAYQQRLLDFVHTIQN